jgi:hypothetical protein
MTNEGNKEGMYQALDFDNNQKIISLSLFGTSKKYIDGSLRFVASAKKNLPDWIIVFFVGLSITEDHLRLLQNTGTRVIQVEEREGLSAASWRFRIWLLGNPGWVIFRDADSVISRREANAVRQWVDSKTTAHMIRDHPFHFAPILAGLWGLRPSLAKWFRAEVVRYPFNDTYGSDQEFLAVNVYPKILSESLIHASFHRHESEGSFGTFEIGNSRFGAFCGESVTSSLLIRGYARLRRLIDSKECQCVR